MGLLILVAAVVLWALWANHKKPPTDTATPKSPQLPVPAAPNSASTGLPAPMALDSEQIVKTEDDIPRCIVMIRDDECAVCQSTRSPRFVTPRLRICQWCITGLHKNAPIDVVAMARVVERFRWNNEAAEPFWSDVLSGHRHHVGIRNALARYGLTPEGTSSSFWLKSLRAFQLGLISGAVVYARPPEDVWRALARVTRSEDGLRCNICGARDEELHVHHIIHLQHYGTNHARNLVTLCHPCHLAQHPGINFCLAPPTEGEDGDN